ncbi:hypothetical protein FO519_009178, partial [Halicephalobus sp. NKZ332]
MLRIYFLSFFLAVTSASPALRSGTCANVATTALYSNCYVDLTVGIDMSLAMGSSHNIKTLDASLLTNYLVEYDIGDTYTAAIAFGFSTINSSSYFTTYEKLCNYIHVIENQAVDIGAYAAKLSEVFTTFRDNQLPTGRNYQKVFVLFTAITDTDNINQAVPIANQVRTAGAQIIIVAVGNTGDTNALSQLGDQVLTSSDFTISDELSRQVVQSSCLNAGVTHSDPVTSTTPMPTTLSNAIGTPCAANVTNAWLDIVLLVDVSNIMTAADLQKLRAQFTTMFGDFTVGQDPRHSSRVAIVTYSTDVRYVYNFTSVTNGADLSKQLAKLPSYQLGESGGNLYGGMQAAQVAFSTQRSYRRQVLIMAVASYDPLEFSDPSILSIELQQDEITLFSISYRPNDNIFTSQLRNLSSPGYTYTIMDKDLISKVSFGLTQANCVCPPRSLQFRMYNRNNNTNEVYSDCLSGYAGDTDPQFTNFACSPGILASITSQQKLHFITDNIVPHDMSGIKNITVGGHRRNGVWYWYGYDNTEYPFGDFPSITDNRGDYLYANNYFGFNWRFLSGESGFQNAKPYLCQIKACDTDYF